jgi:hypothetical protein
MSEHTISDLVWMAAPLILGCATIIYACVVVSRRAKRQDKDDQRRESST